MQEMKRRYLSMYIPDETVDDQFNEHCGVCDEQGIEEAVLADRDYKYDGKVIKISKKNFSKVHRDFKNSTKGQEMMMTYDDKAGTVSVPVEFTEEVEVDENFAVLNEALKPRDKAVIDAFYSRKGNLASNLLSVEGGKLTKMGMGGQEIAIWKNDKIVINAKMDVKSTEEIVRYMKKSIPSGVFEEVEIAEGWKAGKYTIKDDKGKILGTYSSGGKAQKAMNDLMQKGDYDKLEVAMVEEVEIEESNELQAIMALDDVGIEATINKKDQVVVKKKDLKKAEAALKKSFKKGGAPELHGEEVEIDEKFNKKKFDDNEDKNDHTGNGVELVNMFGTTSEKKIMAQIQKNHDKNGEISRKDQSTRDAMVKKYYPKLEEVEIEEKIEKESYGSFITAAAKAKKEGKKTFMMGGKKYPVTIKQKISAAYEEAEVEEAKLYAAKGTAYPATIDTLKMIVKDKQNQTIMFKDGKAMVDLFTASAMTQVYDALKKPEIKKSFEKMILDKAGFLKAQGFAMKMISGK